MNELLTGDSFVINANDKLGRLAMREKIEGFIKVFQKTLGSKTGGMDEINKGLKEHFIGGAYIRELFIPADTAIVSQLWNKERFWMIPTGKVTVTTEMGRQTIVAPYYGPAPFGTRVALYTHEDTLWFAITGTDSDNSSDMEKEVIVKDHSELSYPWDKLEKKL